MPGTGTAGGGSTAPQSTGQSAPQAQGQAPGLPQGQTQGQPQGEQPKQRRLSDFEQRTRKPITDKPVQPKQEVSPFVDPQAKPQVDPTKADPTKVEAQDPTKAEGQEGQDPNEVSPFLDEQPDQMTEAEMAAAFREMQEAGLLQVDKFGDLKVEVTDKYGAEQVSLKDLRDGYLRQRDYTNKTKELAKHRETFVQEATKFQEHMKGLGTDHTKFVDSMELNFGYDHLLKAATLIAERHQQTQIQAIGAGKAAREMARMQLGLAENSRDPRLDQAEQQAAEQMVKNLNEQRKIQLEAAHREREQTNWQKQQEQLKKQEVIKAQGLKWTQQLELVQGAALKSVGLNGEHPEVPKMYRACVAEILRDTDAEDITYDLAKRAAQLLAERTREWRNQWNPGKPSGQPMQAGRTTGASGAPRQAQGTQQKRLSEYKGGKFLY